MNTIISSPNEGDILHMHFIFLRTTPTSNSKGGHTTHAYSFSYGNTPTSSPKGGGGHVPEMPPPPPPPRSTYAY